MPGKPLPIECRARYAEIIKRASHLTANFINGNRNDTYRELKEMEPGAALAVLSLMMLSVGKEERKDINRYLMEVA